MFEHGVIQYKQDSEVVTYLSTLTKVILALYFNVTLVGRELLFFALVLYCLRKGYKDVSQAEFKQVFEDFYFVEGQTKAQKASLFCTLRKNLIDKKLLTYNKNTGTIKVSEAWKHNTNTITINIDLSITN